jgi:hypothetical protein
LISQEAGDRKNRSEWLFKPDDFDCSMATMRSDGKRTWVCLVLEMKFGFFSALGTDE